MFPITYSEKELVFDALPDLQVQYYTKREQTPSIYCYAQCYSLCGDLALSLRAFEQKPPKESRITFAIAAVGKADSYMALDLAPQGKAELKLFLDGCAKTVCEVELARFAGEDEHGWFWGAQCYITKEELAKAQVFLEKGNFLSIAVYKSHEKYGIIGLSYFLSENGAVVESKLFNPAVITAY